MKLDINIVDMEGEDGCYACIIKLGIALFSLSIYHFLYVHVLLFVVVVFCADSISPSRVLVLSLKNIEFKSWIRFSPFFHLFFSSSLSLPPPPPPPSLSHSTLFPCSFPFSNVMAVLKVRTWFFLSLYRSNGRGQ